MNQSERRIYLIKEPLNEQPEYQDIQIPPGEQEQKDLLRSLFDVRIPEPISEDFLEKQDEYLQEETKRKGITGVADLTPIQDNLYLWQGDITTIRCDAIVNAANSLVLGCFALADYCRADSDFLWQLLRQRVF